MIITLERGYFEPVAVLKGSYIIIVQKVGSVTNFLVHYLRDKIRDKTSKILGFFKGQRLVEF